MCMYGGVEVCSYIVMETCRRVGGEVRRWEGMPVWRRGCVKVWRCVCAGVGVWGSQMGTRSQDILPHTKGMPTQTVHTWQRVANPKNR